MRTRNTSTTVMTVALLLIPAGALADGVLLYDVDFGTPPHIVGQPPVTGTGDIPRDRPTSIWFGDPTVVAALGVFTDQPCAFGNGTTGYDQIEFVTSATYPGGLDEAYDTYYIEMDVLVEELAGSWPNDDVAILFDLPLSHSVRFDVNGEIRFSRPGGGGLLGTFEFGIPVFLEIEVEIAANHCTIWLDGIEVHSDFVDASELRAIRINLSGEHVADAAAVDNLRIYGGGDAPCEEPTIIEPPQSQTVYEGDPVTFVVVAAGTPPLEYQWRKDGVDIPDATNDSYTIDWVIPDDAGEYDVMVTNACGSVISDPATLTVTPNCVGDIDGDSDTDWSDLAILLTDYGCMSPSDCVGDLNGDGASNLTDLAILFGDWGCPDDDAACDEPGPGVIDVSVVAVDNSSVSAGDDTTEPAFDGGVTHFTFDLQVQVEPDEDFGAADANAELTEPTVEFFRHTLGPYGDPSDPGYFAFAPALEFDSYWCAASVIGPNQSGQPPLGRAYTIRTAVELAALWYDVDDSGGGTFTIARYTIVVPPGSATPPEIVPAGQGGNVPVIGTITGWVTNASYNPGCDWFHFDIIHAGTDSDGDGIPDDDDNCPDDYNPDQEDTDGDGIGDACDDDLDGDDIANDADNCAFVYNPTQEDCDDDGIGDVCDCPGDVDCDRDVDLSDLAQLLANYGTTTGTTYAQGDLDDDGDVDLSDLALLLSNYGAVCN